jgi:DNA-binding transcriptional MerR regulator
MPISLNGQTYYRTAEACSMVGTNRNTFLRWVRQGLFVDVHQRDRRGWRLFSDYDLRRLQAEVNQIKLVKN